MEATLADKVTKELQAIVMDMQLPLVSHDEDIRTAGVDSLEFVEFIMIVETNFKVNIPEGIAAGLKTVNDFKNFILESRSIR